MKILLLCTIAFCVAAGQPAIASEAASSKATSSKHKKVAAPKTAESCAAAGGTWRKVGMLRQELCDMPTHDAGKSCKSSSECESVCVAPDGADLTKPVTGTCFRSLVLVGTCLARVENGRVATAQCSD